MGTAHRSARAEIDLLEIWNRIAKDDPPAADRQLDRINATCECSLKIREVAHAAKTLRAAFDSFLWGTI